jgi:hypothetical protein
VGGKGLFQQSERASWIDQFALRSDGPGGMLAPFSQAVTAAETLERVASDRTGLTRPTYDSIGMLRTQTRVLADFARSLEADFHRQVRAADASLRPDPLSDVDASGRARALMSSLTAAVDATATLTEICHALLDIAEGLLVIDRAKAKIEIIASVEALRAAVSTSQVTVQANINRITDAVLYDRLLGMIRNVDQTLQRAEQISRTIRNAGPADPLPTQRSEGSTGPLRSMLG